MSKDEELIWEKWITSRDEEAGNILIKKYESLVRYHVQRISVSLPKNVSRDDLRSLGMMGLLDALEKFDTKRKLAGGVEPVPPPANFLCLLMLFII